MTHSRCSCGLLLYRSITSEDRSSPSLGGATHVLLRMKTSQCLTSFWMCGRTCIALLPMPMIATVLSFRSRSSGHAAVCTSFPVYVCSEGISGHFQWFNKPDALIRTSHMSVIRPIGVSIVTVHLAVSSQNTASRTR
jgi:hypothetical protein